jgi:hypothetical protein
MTTRRAAETLLFDAESTAQIAQLEAVSEFPKLEAGVEIPLLNTLTGKDGKGELTETVTLRGKDGREAGGEFPHLESIGEIHQLDKHESNGQIDQLDEPERRRLSATYCPRCRGWVEVRLQPIRLHCTRCGLEARP